MIENNIKTYKIQRWMDGGSVSIICKNEIDEKYTIHIQQHNILISGPDGKMPGRIYLNNKLVKERSENEATILSLLEKLKDTQLQKKINYIRSEEYLKNNQKIENQRLDFINSEFDWIAKDIYGNYGLFSSKGSGIIPMNVIEDYKNHQKITQKIDLVNNGFYTYKIHEDFYVKTIPPNTKITKSIINELSKLRSLIKLNLSFEDTQKIIFD